MQPAILFDDGKGQLSPLTDLRPVFDIRTGALRSMERLRLVLQLKIVALFVPDDMVDLTLDRLNIQTNEIPDIDGPILVINGRCPIPLPQIKELRPGQAIYEKASGDPVAALLQPEAARRFLTTGDDDHEHIEIDDFVLLSRPWHVRAVRDWTIKFDMEILKKRKSKRPPDGVHIIGDPGDAVIDPGATVCPGVTLDLEHGPIVISSGAKIRPGAVLIGPVAVGPNSTIMEQAVIKPNTAIGPVCKVGGEVGGTIFQGYANKSHDGHLGDSWVGEWVNFGAGTSNSNLLNTYGEVSCRATPDGPNERTGEQYLGVIAGDHAKFAINSRIMTGTVVHTGAMLSTSGPIRGCVAPFCWCTDDGERLYRYHKFLEVARSVMGRRDIEPSHAYTDRLAWLHAAESKRLADNFQNA